MGLTNMTGDDSFIINDRPIHPDFAGGDTVTIDFPNDLVSIETGKNKNTIYAKNETGSNFTCTFNVMRGGAVDKFLNGLRIEQDKDFVLFNLMNGAFTKRIGNGQGRAIYDNYVLLGMAFQKNPPAKGNTSGDVEQGKIQYTLIGSVATRGIA